MSTFNPTTAIRFFKNLWHIITMHRQIMGLTFGGDNTRVENSHNMKISKRNKSGAKGVLHATIKTKLKSGKVYTKKYWRANITLNRKMIYLGFFPYNDEGFQKAKESYNKAALKYFGEFARLNE